MSRSSGARARIAAVFCLLTVPPRQTHTSARFLRKWNWCAGGVESAPSAAGSECGVCSVGVVWTWESEWAYVILAAVPHRRRRSVCAWSRETHAPGCVETFSFGRGVQAGGAHGRESVLARSWASKFVPGKKNRAGQVGGTPEQHGDDGAKKAAGKP